ncbi:hypothetical protein FOL47_007083 [Perkinsus chesapeaki]|uniref:Ribophorin II C-terminal domain-containing protein n=1 Tax=Perkinsus chesapeaki TaxID=330153 RepID=A0A7J6LMV3_PERCH|nr:hypothetical protein FOL47_007083 [Perkinsus chesapeaki]
MTFLWAIIRLSIVTILAEASDVANLQRCVVNSDDQDGTLLTWTAGGKSGQVDKAAVLSDTGHPSISCELSNAEFYPAQVALMMEFKSGDNVVGAPGVQVIEMKRESGSSNTYKADIPLSGAGAMVARNGKYELSVLVGDHRMPKGIKQPLGVLPVKFEEATKDTLINNGIPDSKDTRRSTQLAGRYLPLPIIVHTFKPPQKTAPFPITAVFLALTTVIPLLAFIRGLGLLKVNVQLWRFDVHGVIFFGALAGYLGVLGSFFMFLNLFQTLALCLVLLPVAVVSGNRVLCQSRGERLEGRD